MPKMNASLGCVAASSAATHAAMVLKKVRRNCVLRNNAKKPILPRYEVIVIYPQRQLVEKDVAIRAKAKNVLRDIRPVVGATEWLDVTGFRIRACRCYESCAADLADKIVQPLHPLTYRCATDDSSDC
jgi:hypothetical protein